MYILLPLLKPILLYSLLAWWYFILYFCQTLLCFLSCRRQLCIEFNQPHSQKKKNSEILPPLKFMFKWTKLVVLINRNLRKLKWRCYSHNLIKTNLVVQLAFTAFIISLLFAAILATELMTRSSAPNIPNALEWQLGFSDDTYTLP